MTQIEVNPVVATREEWADVLRLPLMVGVVFIHSYDPIKTFGNNEVNLQGVSPTADLLMFYISQIISRLSVPIFFFISGYFLFRELRDRKLIDWTTSIKKRFRTLFIPYIFWNSVAIATVFAAQFLNLVDGSKSRIGNILEWHINDFLYALTGLSGYPAAYQFWFIRDLIVCSILSIFTLRINSKPLLIFTSLLIIYWLIGVYPNSIPSIAAMCFFLLGGLSYRYFKDLAVKRVPAWVLGAYLALSFIELILKDSELISIIHKIGLLVGVASAFWFAQLLTSVEGLKSFLSRYGAASFFVFAAHEPLLTITRKIVATTFSDVNNSIQVLCIYMLPPLIVTLVTLLVWQILREISPSLLRFITGGR